MEVLTHLQYRHASNDRSRILDSSRVDSVIGTNDKHHICVAHVRVDLLHLLHDVIWHARLGQEHVQLPWHATSYWVDAKPTSKHMALGACTVVV